MRPRADPETPLTEAAPAKVMGLPVEVGAVATPVEATEVTLVTPVGEATPLGTTAVETAATAEEVASHA